MTTPARRVPLEEVLDEAFFSADKPSSAIVLRVCLAHPEYRDEILEFAALWSSYEASPEPIGETAVVPEESVGRLQSYVLHRLHEATSSTSRIASSTEIVSDAIGGLAGGSLRRAAKAAELGEATILLQKVLTNRISEVPRIVLDRLAEHLGLSFELLVNALCPGLAGARSYKASGKPVAPTTESWESAVRALSVSEEEKKRLLSLKD